MDEARLIALLKSKAAALARPSNSSYDPVRVEFDLKLLKIKKLVKYLFYLFQTIYILCESDRSRGLQCNASPPSIVSILACDQVYSVILLDFKQNRNMPSLQCVYTGERVFLEDYAKSSEKKEFFKIGTLKPLIFGRKVSDKQFQTKSF